MRCATRFHWFSASGVSLQFSLTKRGEAEHHIQCEEGDQQRVHKHERE